MATVASRAGRNTRLAIHEGRFKRAARRFGITMLGLALAGGAVLILLALASYQPSDPSLNTRSGGEVRNWLGPVGAWTADLLLTLVGPLAVLLLPLLLLTGLRLVRAAGAGPWGRSLRLTLAGIVLVGTAASLLVGGAVNSLPAGWGGAIGLGLASLLDLLLGAAGTPDVVAPFRLAAAALTALGGLRGRR